MEWSRSFEGQIIPRTPPLSRRGHAGVSLSSSSHGVNEPKIPGPDHGPQGNNNAGLWRPLDRGGCTRGIRIHELTGVFDEDVARAAEIIIIIIVAEA